MFRRVCLFLFLLLLSWRPAMAAPTLIVGTNINISHLSGNQSEEAIGIDPTNPNHLFVAANVATATGLFAAYSTNGGTNWSYTDPSDGVIVDGNDSLPAACCDPTVTWDLFGNLYLGYINDNLTEIDIVVSTNGGVSFTKTIKLAIGDDVDQPTIVAGTGGGSNSVWITYRDDAKGGLVAQGARVTGLGNIGAFGTVQAIPGTSGDGSFGDICIGPSNQVMVAYQIPTGGETNAAIYINVDPDGTGPVAFGTQIRVTSTAVGGFDFIPAQSRRSVDAEAGLAWDTNPTSSHYGRVYLMYTDETPDESNNMDIYVRYSDNNGASWSSAVKVNDDIGTNSQFLPKIALDPTTGNVAVVWHDCRRDLGVGGAGDRNHKPNDDAQFWGAVSSDGGLTWSTNVQISAGTSEAAAANNGIDYGDYTGLTFYGGNFFPVWSDNSNSTGNNPGGTNTFDIYTAKVNVSAVVNTNSADLKLVMSATPNPVLIGSNLTYTLSLTNLGPAVATNVALTNILPSNVTFVSATNTGGTATFASGKVTCSITTLASNASATITIKVTPTVSAYITNTASVTSPKADPNTGNNTASVVTLVSPADLRLGITESPDPVYIGYYETYTIRITNAGPATATGVTLLDTLPFTCNFTSATLSQGTYNLSSNLLTCSLGTLASNATATVTVVVQTTTLGTIANNVVVQGNEVDTNINNNGASPEAQVVDLPPMIANISAVTRINSAFITWNTFSNGTTQVAWGLTTNYDNITPLDGRLTNNHSVFLTGLQSDTTYYFEVISRVQGVVYTGTGSFFTSSGLIVDNPDALYEGRWTIGLATGDTYGEYYQYALSTNGFASSQAFYTPNLPASGKYDVSIWYSQGTNRTANAQVFVSGKSDIAQADVDQTAGGGQWNLITSGMQFDAGTDGFVMIANDTGENNKLVIADAVRWSQNLAAESPVDGTVPDWWAQFYFGTNFVDGTLDPDADGYSNYKEFVLGTAPNDAGSRLNFRIERLAGGGARAVFAPFMGGRTYRLQYLPDVGASTWITLTNAPVVNANGEGVITVSNPPAANSFFRLSAQLVP